MSAEIYCLIGTSVCYPIAWWACAAAWFQAVATVATFYWALVVQRARDAREQKSRDEAQATDKIRHMQAETAALESQTAKMRRETAHFKLQMSRFARALRDALSPVLAREYESPASEIAAYREFLLNSKDIPVLRDLSGTSGVGELSPAAISLVMSIESLADACRDVATSQLQAADPEALAPIALKLRS